jgi:threonine/homoserine/homoserine lactone efflux protein
VLFTLGGTVVNIGVALAAGSLARGLAGRGHLGTWLQRAAGALFVVLGLRLAFGGR